MFYEMLKRGNFVDLNPYMVGKYNPLTATLNGMPYEYFLDLVARYEEEKLLPKEGAERPNEGREGNDGTKAR